MESSTEQVDVESLNLLRSEAEAFTKVCHRFFDQIPEPEGELPHTLVLELTHGDNIRQLHFVVWPKQTVPSVEENHFPGGDEQGFDQPPSVGSSERPTTG